MKTLLITSFHGIISRNILSTGLIPHLAAKQVRVVIVCPEHKREFFEVEFAHTGAVIATVTARLSSRDTFLRYLALAAINTRTLKNKRKTELKGSSSILSLFLANAPGRALVRALSSLLTPREPFGALLKEYAPALVFSTDIQNEYDIRLMSAARDAHITVVSMVRSWDNLTSKGLVRFIPEVLAVNNEVIEREAVTLHDIPKERIHIVGIPHYDRYHGGGRTSREAFFDRIGGDQSKKMLLFVPTGDRYMGDNPTDAELLALVDRDLPANFQILVRFPPADRVRAFEGREDTARIIYDRPSTRFAAVKETELGRAEDDHLADTLHHADIVVSGPSTMCIDAAAFNKPVILAGFDGEQVRPYLGSIRRYYDYDHFAPVLASGGVAFVESKEALKAALDAFITNQEEGTEGRQRLVREECYAFDGRSSERLAAVLIGALPK